MYVKELAFFFFLPAYGIDLRMSGMTIFEELEKEGSIQWNNTCICSILCLGNVEVREVVGLG